MYSYANGDKYDGEWKNDFYEGAGVYTYTSGAEYILDTNDEM